MSDEVVVENVVCTDHTAGHIMDYDRSEDQYVCRLCGRTATVDIEVT